MFAQAYPDLEPMYSKYPEKFRALWQAGIDAQKDMRVVWNIGFRGQGDRPFWDDDPQYDTPEKRGALISSLIKEQYDLVRANDPEAVCCTNLYGETMELYKDGFLQLPADVIKIWADNGFGKMVSRRQENNNPRVPALPRWAIQAPTVSTITHPSMTCRLPATSRRCPTRQPLWRRSWPMCWPTVPMITGW